MSMFDTVQFDTDMGFSDSELVTNGEWQIELEREGLRYKVDENKNLLKAKLKLKEDADVEDESDIKPENLERHWVETDVSGVYSLRKNHKGQTFTMDVVLEDGKIVDVDPSISPNR